MKNSTAQKIAAVTIPLALALSFTATAFATTASVGAKLNTHSSTAPSEMKARLETREKDALTKSQTEITARVAALTELSTRVNAMTHVSASTKASISASIQGTISSLNTLGAKIATDNAADLKTDMLSITKGTRVYMLLVPQLRILAAGDRAKNVADMLTSFDAKVKTRITEATTAGKNVTALVSAESDMSLKVADANLQASAAITAVSGLTPDNGDKTKMAANETALKTARAALKVAETDLRAAQKDMKTIVLGLKELGGEKVSASESVEAK